MQQQCQALLSHHIFVHTSDLLRCRFGQLQQADVSGVEPAVRADINANNVLREDVPVECDSRHVLCRVADLHADCVLCQRHNVILFLQRGVDG